MIAAVLTGACGESAPTDEPDHITVDHILIGVTGAQSIIRRTEDQGRQIAERLMERLKGGASWTKLKNDYSEDPATKGPPRGGPYDVANTGVAHSHAGEHSRKSMAPAFGDLAFKLAVGETALARFHPKTSPIGFHIIKRIR
jgi:parvulin-like peptidyl-prolyl isomerase